MKKVLLLISSFLFISSLTNAQLAGNWTLLGPILYPITDIGEVAGIGRIEQIKFDPMNVQIVYATSANGGLFVSKDGANTWNTTGTDSSGLHAASICIDYTNDSILYLGTGDINYYSTDVGIWKSTDAGATWTASHTNIRNRMAVEILMSPLDHNTLIAATNNGIWKSIDAGATWVEKHVGGQFTDMQFKPNATTQTIYATSINDYWYSTDMGETWTTVALPVPASALQQGGRIGVSKADSTVVYLTFVGNDSASCTPILKSTNSGASFIVIKPADSCDLNGYDTANYAQYYQGNYNFCMIVDPTDINTIYVAAERVWKSTDGGVHWSTSFPWWLGLHTDQHYFTFYPNNPTRLLNADDGGIFETDDSNTTWHAMSNGLSTSECYHAANSPIKQNFVLSGLQDNGGLYYNNSVPWHTFVMEDASNVWACDYADSTLWYDMPDGVWQELSVSVINLAFPFPNGNNDLIAFSNVDSNVCFIADSDVFISKNILTSWNASVSPTWNKISGFAQPFAALATSTQDKKLLFAADQNGNFYYTANALNASPTWITSAAPGITYNGAWIAPVASNTNIVYMSCYDHIYRSTDKGAAWTDVTANLPGGYILGLYNDIYSTNEAMYLATSSAVYYKDSTMTNWINYSKGLPNTAPITELMIYNNGTDSSKLRVSFYGRGVWQSPLYSNNIFTTTQSVIKSPTSFNAFPNPNNGMFSVKFNSPLKANYTLSVVNVLGKEVYQKRLENCYGSYTALIDVSQLSEGMYLIILQGDKGLSTKKIVIQ